MYQNVLEVNCSIHVMHTVVNEVYVWACEQHLHAIQKIWGYKSKNSCMYYVVLRLCYIHPYENSSETWCKHCSCCGWWKGSSWDNEKKFGYTV